MRIPFHKLDPGVLPNSKDFFFASPLTEQECHLFYYIPWCGHFFCTSQYFHKREYWPYCLIMYVRRGKFRIEYRGEAFDAFPGDVILLDCTESHCYAAYDGLEFLYLHFSGANAHKLCQYYLNKSGPLIRSLENDRIQNFLVNTIAFYDEDKYESIFDTSMRVYKFLQMIFNTGNLWGKNRNSNVEFVLNYINQNLGNNFSLQHLADMVQLSPYYFSHLFKKETGVSPFDYILNMRMNRSGILLITTNHSIADIAKEVGYKSAASFTNVFTEKMGCSPSRYRKLMR